MPSVRLYVKKQLRLDRLTFRQRMMADIGFVAVESVKQRLARAQGPGDGPAKPISKYYAKRKSKLGRGNRRNLTFTGEMLKNFSLRTVAENKARAGLTIAKLRSRGLHNQLIEPWVVFSPRNRQAIFEKAARVFRDNQKRLVLEKWLGGKQT